MEEKQLAPRNNNNHQLEQSIMITPMPTTRGFGLLRSTCDLIWNEEENLYSDLVHKTFDPNNSSYHRKLDTAIEILVDKQNDERLAEMIDVCRRDYNKKIQISDTATCKAHAFLVQTNKDLQTSFAKRIAVHDKICLEGQNQLLEELKSYVSAQIAKIKQLYTDYAVKREDIVKEECEEIRRIKKALIQLHNLNKTCKLPADGYCSDDEKNADNLTKSYNNQYILQKINVNYAIEQTNTKSLTLIKTLTELDQKIQVIESLNNKHFAIQ